MTEQSKVSYNPLILRYQRLISAFSKSDDERDFYLDKLEGFIIYVDLDKTQEELDLLEKEVKEFSDRYYLIPKLTFYETKKIMEGFVTEKVYDIDTKERLLDIIQSKDSTETFLEFIYDHEAETEKWQQYYLEKFRIRVIEWLRQHFFDFVFEEDLDIHRDILTKVKKVQFKPTAPKDIQAVRMQLKTKAKTYYSSEALNPRPKRGRPPKQVAKVEVEHQMMIDFYETVPNIVRPFLFCPENAPSATFTFPSKYHEEESNSTFRPERLFGNPSHDKNPEPELPKIDFSKDDDDDDDDDDVKDKKETSESAKGKKKPKKEAVEKMKKPPVRRLIPKKTSTAKDEKTKSLSKATKKAK